MRIHRTGRTTLLLAGGLFLAAQLGTGIGCSDDEKETEPDPTFPGQTPSTATMQIDLSELNDSGSPLARTGVSATLLVFSRNARPKLLNSKNASFSSATPSSSGGSPSSASKSNTPMPPRRCRV